MKNGVESAVLVSKIDVRKQRTKIKNVRNGMKSRERLLLKAEALRQEKVFVEMIVDDLLMEKYAMKDVIVTFPQYKNAIRKRYEQRFTKK